MHGYDEPEDSDAEHIYELNQENIQLRGQITYLQEELSSVEDELDKMRNKYEQQIESLEKQLGNASTN